VVPKRQVSNGVGSREMSGQVPWLSVAKVKEKSSAM